MNLRIIFSFFTMILFLQVESVYSLEIASCRNPKGHAFYHDIGNWQRDGITDGITTLQKLNNGKYDIFIIDVRKKIISLTQDGGEILLLRKGTREATFMHIYPGTVIELYTFWIGLDGKAHFDIIQSKGGDNPLIVRKSAVYVGDCDEIKLDLIE